MRSVSRSLRDVAVLGAAVLVAGAALLHSTQVSSQTREGRPLTERIQELEARIQGLEQRLGSVEREVTGESPAPAQPSNVRSFPSEDRGSAPATAVDVGRAGAKCSPPYVVDREGGQVPPQCLDVGY